ncbi:MAG TPA: transcription termination/antitermination NusG family protein [Pirellulales bacterium]|nr:transcription termination/antitermination NusG family protein [Pirellulales bacterium]
MPILSAETDCFPANLLAGLAVSDHEAPLRGAETSDRTWWVMHTKPRQEKSVARDLLCREMSFYLPTISQTKIVRGRKQVSHLPLFTGYVFLFGNELERHSIMITNRIAHFLSVADPRLLTRQLHDLSRLISAGAPLTVESRLKAGDQVRVKSGALAGVEGTVVARRRRCRMIVSVSLLQQGVSIEIDDHLLEPIG